MQESDAEMAVVLDSVTLTYADLRGRPKGICRSRKWDQGLALNGVSLRADRGSIYGLLGPSGCGKTSVLSCCLGVCRPTSGRALVLGRVPASAAAGVPGPDVGYMPQTESLHSFLTPSELLQYYGTIFGVDRVNSRVEEMLDLVEINDGRTNKRQVTRLSGGERRRVSLACALVHKPPLIILDEPTVGVDPILRLKIWDTLRGLASSEGTTVMVTTHYMEEAARADKVGFMRAGRMLQEGRPRDIKDGMGSRDLDVAFFRLCARDEEEDKKTMHRVESPMSTEFTDDGESTPLIGENPADLGRQVNGFSFFRALCFKNWMAIRRNGLFMFFQAIMPIITFLIFIACIGSPIKDLRLSVYNGEGDCANWTSPACSADLLQGGLVTLLSKGELPSLGPRLSCVALSHLDEGVFGTITYWESKGRAEHSVWLGESDAAITFSANFSTALVRRAVAAAMLTSGSDNDDAWDDEDASLLVKMDATDATLASAIKVSLVRTARDFLLGYASNCGLPELSRLLRAADGLDAATTAQEYALKRDLKESVMSVAMLPGMMALLLQMLAMALTSDLLIKEKVAGLLVRDFVCGMSLTWALLANLLCMLIVVVAQIVFSLVMLFILFPDLTFGTLAALALLFLLQALCGMTVGFLLTAIFPTVDQVIQAGIALIFPVFLLSGVLWPRVAMPGWLSAVAVALPGTIACDLARAIVASRGTQVPMLYIGYLMPLLWTLIFFTLTLFIIRRWGFKV